MCYLINFFSVTQYCVRHDPEPSVSTVSTTALPPDNETNVSPGKSALLGGVDSVVSVSAGAGSDTIQCHTDTVGE